MPSPKTISQYIATFPPATRKKLKEMHATISKSAPNAIEGIKWSMPAFSYKRMLVAYAGYKHHIGFYPTPSALKKFEKEISKYKHARGSVQFPLIKPLPLTLIKKITAFRVKESLEKDKKWRS